MVIAECNSTCLALCSISTKNNVRREKKYHQKISGRERQSSHHSYKPSQTRIKIYGYLCLMQKVHNPNCNSYDLLLLWFFAIFGRCLCYLYSKCTARQTSDSKDIK